MAKRGSLPVSSVNHISLLCSNVQDSVAFYEDVLGFLPIKRPGSFDFDGAWLFNYDVGIHLIQASQPNALPKKKEINPRDNHISLQTACQGIEEVEEQLKVLGVEYLKVQVEEGGILVDQIFFHDPDGFMIEVCTCENLPVIPLRADDVRPFGSRSASSVAGSLPATSSSCSRQSWLTSTAAAASVRNF